jgi:hypothetical protein
MKALIATPRTVSAIRKADRLPTVVPGGKMRKGSLSVSGDNGCYPARVLSKDGTTYLCDLYENGVGLPATRTNVPVLVLQIEPAETIPAGTWIMAAQSAIGAIGGGGVPA